MSRPLRILVVDDDRRMARTLQDIFRVTGYEALAAYSGQEALDKVSQEEFDCILSDIRMPEVHGVDLFKAIKAKRPDLPVVLMTAYSAHDLVKEGLEEGVLAVMSKPLDIDRLLSFFSSLRKEQSVVIVDDDLHFCKTLGHILRARGFAVTEITDPHSIVEKVKGDGEIVLLDMKLNSITGLDVLREIRKEHPTLPVILITGYREDMAPAIRTALQIGAYTCLYKPFQVEDLMHLLAEVRHRELGRMLG